MFDPDNSITIIPEDIYESNLFLHLIVLVYAACGRYWTCKLAWTICQCTLNILGLYCSLLSCISQFINLNWEHRPSFLTFRRCSLRVTIAIFIFIFVNTLHYTFCQLYITSILLYKTVRYYYFFILSTNVKYSSNLTIFRKS